MNLNALRLFWQVAHHLSFSKAAVAAGISQPAVSRAVADLEASVGLPLFIRARRPLTLTLAGNRLLTHAEDIFTAERNAELAMAAARVRPARQVRIAASSTLACHTLAEPLARFSHENPDVHISVQTGNLHAIAGLYGHGQIDFGFIEGVLQGFEHLPTQPFGTQELGLYVDPAHPFGQVGDPIDLAMLGGERMIMREPGSATFGFVAGLLVDAGVFPAKYIQATDSDTVVALTAAGAGLSIMPVAAASAAEALGQIKRVMLRTALSRSTLLIRPNAEQGSNDAARFLDHILLTSDL